MDKIEVLNATANLPNLGTETKAGRARLDTVCGTASGKASRRAFERTKCLAASKMLSSRKVAERVRTALIEGCITYFGYSECAYHAPGFFRGFST